MLFSIIVPIYNVEKYLERCVTSLINQTFQDIEIILVDDGSPDKCPELCDQYAEIDTRIKVIHKKNGGLSDARNAGLTNATGDYVLFVDSDDYIDTYTCEKFSVFAEKGYDILVGQAVLEGRKQLHYISSSDYVYTGKEYLLSVLQLKKSHMAVCLNVYRRLFLLENDLLFKFGIVHEDEQFTPRAFLNAQSVVCTGILFYHYVHRDGSITSQKDKRKHAQDIYSTCMELEDIYSKNTDGELQLLLLDYLTMLYLSSFQNAKGYLYGKEYIHKDFVKRNSKLPKTRMKKMLFCFSPRIYWWINNTQKKLKK